MFAHNILYAMTYSLFISTIGRQTINYCVALVAHVDLQQLNAVNNARDF